jgi:hypothetical protein
LHNLDPFYYQHLDGNGGFNYTDEEESVFDDDDSHDASTASADEDEY